MTRVGGATAAPHDDQALIERGHANASMATDSASSASAQPNKYQLLQSIQDIHTIRDLTEDAVRDILRHKLGDHALQIVEMGAIQDMSGLNDAFNSTICSLKVKARLSPAPNAAGRGDQEAPEQEFNCVIKSPPKMSFIRQVHKFSRPFFNEVSWYLELVPQLELSAGAGALSSILPECYHAHSDYYASQEGAGTCCTRSCPWFCWLPCKASDSGVLVLENVKMRAGKSYSMFDKRKPLPLDHVLVIMKELAKFHGKWLKWIHMAKNKTLEGRDGVEPLSYTTFSTTYNTQSRIPSVLYNQLKNVAQKTTIKILKKCGAQQEENVAKCNRFFNTTAMRLLDEYMHNPVSPVHTLCHGDFWSNNILFSYKEDGSVNDLIFIDFQLINYGHPAYDLVYFMFLNTDLEFRDQHLRTVLETYYENFHPYILEACSKDFTYSLGDFLREFNYHRPIGFTTACSVMPNVMSGTPLDLESGSLSALRELQRKQAQELDDDNNEATKEIRRRIVQLVTEMAREGVI